jgi:hypothetical protein
LAFDERVDVMALIAERRILEAMEAGQFDNLPGAGRPLPPDDLELLPDEVRLAFRMLRSGGYSPEPLIVDGAVAADPLAGAPDEARMVRDLTRLQLLLGRSGPSRAGGSDPAAARPAGRPGRAAPEPAEAPSTILDSPYLSKILARLVR